jgi:hypothetical protein
VHPEMEELIIEFAECLAAYFKVAYLTEMEVVEIDGGKALNLTFKAKDYKAAKLIFEEGKIGINLSLL